MITLWRRLPSCGGTFTSCGSDHDPLHAQLDASLRKIELFVLVRDHQDNLLLLDRIQIQVAIFAQIHVLLVHAAKVVREGHDGRMVHNEGIYRKSWRLVKQTTPFIVYRE